MPQSARKGPGRSNARYSLTKADGTPIGPPWGHVIEEDPDPDKFPYFPPLGPPQTPSVALPVSEIDQAWIDQATDEACYNAALARFQSMTPADKDCVLDDARYGPHVIQHQLTTSLRYFLTNYLNPIRRGQVCDAWYNSFSQTRPPNGRLVPRISDVKFRYLMKKNLAQWAADDAELNNPI